MPDLDLVYVQVCNHDVFTENVIGSKGDPYDVLVSRDGSLDRCTCPGFMFRGKCKHVTAAREKLCDWREDTSPEKQTPQQEMEAVCPKCGSETKVERMGV